jgi:hypothetical protein
MLDRAIQRKELDSEPVPYLIRGVKPENDGKELTFGEL